VVTIDGTKYISPIKNNMILVRKKFTLRRKKSCENAGFVFCERQNFGVTARNYNLKKL
jgi:hypothetical protein